MIRRILLTLLLLAPLAVLGAVFSGLLRIPPEWDPRAPLDFRAEPNLMTPWKMARIGLQPSACLAAFEASGITPQRLPDRPEENGCALVNTMRLQGESAVLSPARPVVTCPVAAAWLMFERHALQPAAEAHFNSSVTGVRHLGSYACRNVYGRAAGRRSQHATANAIDIAGFTLANGREVRLPRDWGEAADGSPAAFLRDVRDGACRFFGAVLGPDYNAAHRDHFHMEAGRWRRCS
ncbi:extensin-like domain-containing protein [Pseudoroseomonas ludipueritiae]|uniref:Extensin family protein n=1 Tax=Pseudoroseomonas ludipueritiae TaxID=198093 RepID=A0ABR7R880_9PROT|nr:extensin family protein [Pseudoroseomonas ludipueritiae]MBC9177891.1 extensin family protein [Pseudoroseomonas ludipueritiae]